MLGGLRREFEELKKECSSVEDLYLSYAFWKGSGRKESLIEHIRGVLEYMQRLKTDYQRLVALRVRQLSEALGNKLALEEGLEVAGRLMDFIAVYHDIGKAEVGYQLYAHGRRKHPPIPHNYTSILLLYNREQDIEESAIGYFYELSGDMILGEKLALACLISIALHHEYYDYKDLSNLLILTPLSIMFGKEIPANTGVLFDLSSLRELLDRLEFDWKPKLRRESTNAYECMLSISSIYCEGVSSSLALRGRRADVRAWSIITSLLSLAEILTWILSIADNLAGGLRGSREGDSWGFSLSRSLKRYYMR